MAEFDVRYQKTTREVKPCPPCPPPPKHERPCRTSDETVHPIILVLAFVGACLAAPIGVGLFEAVRASPILGGVVGFVVGFFLVGGVAAAIAEAAGGYRPT